MLSALRSATSLLLVLLGFLPMAVLVVGYVWPVVQLFPARRLHVFRWYSRLVSGMILNGLELGGARFRREGTLPTEGPSLVLMNHQSLLDIPTVFLMAAPPKVPAFVTRKRYAKWIPVISTGIRILGCPLIDPKRQTRAQLMEALAEGARRVDSGLIIFPEGHRTRDGELLPFKLAGAEALLKARRMPVYLVVTDGFWTCPKLVDFAFKVHRLNGRTLVVGPFEPPAAEADLLPFLEEMRRRVAEQLQAMRQASASAAA